MTNVTRRIPRPHNQKNTHSVRTLHLDLPVGLRVLQARVRLQLREAPDRRLLVLPDLGWVRLLGVDPELCQMVVCGSWDRPIESISLSIGLADADIRKWETGSMDAPSRISCTIRSRRTEGKALAFRRMRL